MLKWENALHSLSGVHFANERSIMSRPKRSSHGSSVVTIIFHRPEDHPTARELLLFSLGQLTEKRGDEIQWHLITCLPCLRTLRSARRTADMLHRAAPGKGSRSTKAAKKPRKK